MTLTDKPDISESKLRLLLECLPFVSTEKCFSLKGGTAINLFLLDFPRISLDIDLVYLPEEDDNTSHESIDQSLRAISKRISSTDSDISIDTRDQKMVSKLYVGRTYTTSSVPETTVKIEVQKLIRGTLFASKNLALQKSVPFIGKRFEMSVISVAELYGGKFHAALGRQSPRDLFDVHVFYKHFEVTDEMRLAFMVFLISEYDLPSMILAPVSENLSDAYEADLMGLMNSKVSLEELYETRERLKLELVGGMPEEHKDFIKSFYQGEPDWKLLNNERIANLPAVVRKVDNLKDIGPKNRNKILSGLESSLNG